MQPEIRQPSPTAGIGITLRSRGIGGDSRDLEIHQQLFCARAHPARVPGLQRDAVIEPLSEHFEESASGACLECEAGRQLNQQTAESGAQRFEIGQECIDQRSASREPESFPSFVDQDKARSQIGSSGNCAGITRFRIGLSAAILRR